MYRILLIQGPNMVALGHRQPEYYGTTTAAELDQAVRNAAPGEGLDVDIRYISREGEAVDVLNSAEQAGLDGLLMNPAGFLDKGRSLAHRVGLLSVPYIEIHMSNIDKRGRRSELATVADGMIAGFGVQSYLLAMSAIRQRIENRS